MPPFSTFDTRSILHHLFYRIALLFFYQVNDQLVEIPEFAPNIRGVLWEMWALDKVSTTVYTLLFVSVRSYLEQILGIEVLFCHLILFHPKINPTHPLFPQQTQLQPIFSSPVWMYRKSCCTTQALAALAVGLAKMLKILV